MSRSGILREYYLQSRYGGSTNKFFKFITKIDGKEFSGKEFKEQIMEPFEREIEQQKLTFGLISNTEIENARRKYDEMLKRSHKRYSRDIDEAKKQLGIQEKYHNEAIEQLELRHKLDLMNDIKFRNKEITELITQQRPFTLYNSHFPHKKYLISDSDRLENYIVSLGGVLPENRVAGFWTKKAKRTIFDKTGEELLTVNYKQGVNQTTAPIYALNSKRYDEHKDIVDNYDKRFFKNMSNVKGKLGEVLGKKARKFETLLTKSKPIDLMDTI